MKSSCIIHPTWLEEFLLGAGAKRQLKCQVETITAIDGMLDKCTDDFLFIRRDDCACYELTLKVEAVDAVIPHVFHIWPCSCLSRVIPNIIYIISTSKVLKPLQLCP